jgi:hypothetical protein
VTATIAPPTTYSTAEARIACDHRRSTPWTNVYLVPSNTAPYPREVRHDTRLGRWSCSCPARVTCHHIREAQVFERERWWRKLIGSLGEADLREFHRTLRSRVGGPGATEDDRIAYRVLTSPLVATD